MDTVQEQFEKGIGDRFFEWFNSETGACFSFTGRADRAPDLVYSSNGEELLIEVPPGITTVEALSALLRLQPVQGGTPFAGIYVVGRFPITTHSRGGYRVIPLKELSREYVD